ncbi:MAG: hypothetical protein KME60_28900 [Cyanomargarita calcarea GSE-NOS-MK-12-04C]|uniref:Uncharacterized protein n=1 Tax=Cyanomargarita calcarea GSE-NOS-MK-12-04C TaxID=2839659 RepID=A0A951QUU1_9CYAN|nr:hypothetical protein [Cyanomargarita calcarea GSE-NOS-MK-12-04C]
MSNEKISNCVRSHFQNPKSGRTPPNLQKAIAFPNPKNSARISKTAKTIERLTFKTVATRDCYRTISDHLYP